MSDKGTVPLHEWLRVCPNCGECGPHMVPPSLGDPALWICKANPQLVAEKRDALEAKYAAAQPEGAPDDR